MPRLRKICPMLLLARRLLLRCLMLSTCYLAAVSPVQAEGPTDSGRILLLRRNYRTEYVVNPAGGRRDGAASSENSIRIISDRPTQQTSEVRVPPLPPLVTFKTPQIPRQSLERSSLHAADGTISEIVPDTDSRRAPQVAQGQNRGVAARDSQNGPETVASATRSNESDELQPRDPSKVMTGNAPFDNRPAETELSRLAQTRPRPDASSVSDSITVSNRQAASLILVILACFLILTVIAVVPLRLLVVRREQVVRLDLNDALLFGAALRNGLAAPPAVRPPERGESRETVVTDLSQDSELLDGMQMTMAEDWTAREEQTKQQEAKMIQAVVEQNIAINGRLAAAAPEQRSIAIS